MPDCPCHLNGLHVLVTRPQHQAGSILNAITRCHGNPTHLPLLEIVSETEASITSQLARLDACDDIIFISPNAVMHSVPFFKPGTQRIIAIGKATASALKKHRINVDLIPELATSEGLLNTPSLGDMNHRRVMIIRGNGGRELLATALQERGAHVDYSQVYSRQCPQLSFYSLQQALQDRHQAIISTSSQITDNLAAISQQSKLVLRVPLIVISPRIKQHASQLGFSHINVAKSAADTDLLDALCAVTPASDNHI